MWLLVVVHSTQDYYKMKNQALFKPERGGTFQVVKDPGEHTRKPMPLAEGLPWN